MNKVLILLLVVVSIMLSSCASEYGRNIADGPLEEYRVFTYETLPWGESLSSVQEFMYADSKPSLIANEDELLVYGDDYFMRNNDEPRIVRIIFDFENDELYHAKFEYIYDSHFIGTKACMRVFEKLHDDIEKSHVLDSEVVSETRSEFDNGHIRLWYERETDSFPTLFVEYYYPLDRDLQ